MRTKKIELESKMPIILHHDDINWSDQMELWKNDPSNRAKSKAGDDRTPVYRWLGCLYYDDPEKGVVTIPSENVMRCLMDGGARVPTGKGRGTFKSQTQSGMISESFHWSFFNNGKPVPMAAIQKMAKLPTFKEHCDAAKDLGFELFMKRVKIGKNKHIRVRPMFHHWSLRGELMIHDDQITDRVLTDMFEIAGRLIGLGDWRPSAPERPGPFGTFTAKFIS